MNIVILVALSFVNAVSWASRYSFHFNYEQMDVDLTGTEYGVLSGFGYTVIYILFLIPWGRAADHPMIGNRNVIMIGLLIQMIFTSVQGYAWDFWSLMTFRFGIAAGQAAIVSPCVAIIGKSFLPDELSTANAVFTVGYFGGSGFVASLSQPVTYWYGDRITFIIYGLLCGLAILIFFIAVPDDVSAPSEDEQKKDTSPDVDTTLSTLKLWFVKPSLALVLLAGCGKMIAEFMFLSMVPSFVLNFWASDPESQGQVAVFFGTLTMISSIIGTTCGGMLSDYLMHRGVKIAPALVPAIAAVISCPLVLFTFLAEASLTAHFVSMFLWCLIIDVWPGPTNSLIQTLLPTRVFATGYSVFLVVTTLFGSFGPVLAGHLMDRGADMGLVIASFAVVGYAIGAAAYLTLCVTSPAGFEKCDFDLPAAADAADAGAGPGPHGDAGRKEV